MIPVKADDHPTELAAPKVLDVTAFCQVLILWLFFIMIGLKVMNGYLLSI